MKWLRLVFCGIIFLFKVSPSTAADVRVAESSDGWRLIVDGKPFFVKGICYYPTKVGESADDGTWRDWMTVDDDHDGRIDAPYQSWVDKNRNDRQDPGEKVVGDFQLMKEMGCNAIRVYHHASSSPQVQKINETGTGTALHYNHAPNKELLRDLYKTYGIRVAMGDFLGTYTIGSGAPWDGGTDYSDPVQRKNMLASVEDMVREFKDEDFLLMWVLGNETNYREATHTNAATHPKDFAEFVNIV